MKGNGDPVEWGHLQSPNWALPFLCADLGLELEPRPDRASYIASWMEVLKDDRRFIFTAAALASGRRTSSISGKRRRSSPER
jgi:antirestriction protein ArdC